MALVAAVHQRSPATVVLGLEIGLGSDQLSDHAPDDSGERGENRFLVNFERN